MQETDKSLIIPDISDQHARLIDEYLANGGNKTQSYLTVYPDVSYNTAANSFKNVIKRPEVVQYLRDKQEAAREQADIKSIDILNTLKTWLHADPTQYIGLTPDEIKELPPEVRQCIQDIDYKTKTYTNRQGQEITEVQCKVKLVSKTDTIEKINKHLGFYSADNKQKGININMLIQNLTKDNPDGALQLLQAIESSSDTDEG